MSTVNVHSHNLTQIYATALNCSPSWRPSPISASKHTSTWSFTVSWRDPGSSQYMTEYIRSHFKWSLVLHPENLQFSHFKKHSRHSNTHAHTRAHTSMICRSCNYVATVLCPVPTPPFPSHWLFPASYFPQQTNKFTHKHAFLSLVSSPSAGKIWSILFC